MVPRPGHRSEVRHSLPHGVFLVTVCHGGSAGDHLLLSHSFSSSHRRLRWFRLGIEGHQSATAIENAVVSAPVAKEIKMRLEPGFVQHSISVAAYRENPAGFYQMVLVQFKAVGAVFNCPL